MSSGRPRDSATSFEVFSAVKESRPFFFQRSRPLSTEHLGNCSDGLPGAPEAPQHISSKMSVQKESDVKKARTVAYWLVLFQREQPTPQAEKEKPATEIARVLKAIRHQVLPKRELVPAGGTGPQLIQQKRR